MTTQPQLKQKLVSFTEGSPEMEKTKYDLENGWAFTSLVNNGGYFVGIMEELSNQYQQEEKIFIPARKKIKIYSPQ